VEVELELEASKPKIHTRDFFFEAGEVLLQIAKRNKVPLLVAVVAIDDFEKLHDEYQAKVVDDIFQFVIQKIQDKCRTSDIIANVENGKIGLIFYNTTNVNSKLVFETISAKIEENMYTLNEETKVPLTVSIGGVVMHNLVSARTMDALYDQAKIALDTVQRKGKNSVLVY
jgi:diguanylate cyclase (GGDEF)-like protein